LFQVDQFLESLIHYDKENIHPNIITALEPYLKDKEFDPEFIKSKSAAAAGLCSWVINIVRFFDVYCDVEPKRRALDEANAELLAARQKLLYIKNKVCIGLEPVFWSFLITFKNSRDPRWGFIQNPDY
jgi:dynein heavy chain